MSRQQILEKVQTLPSPPIVFQCLWDGDSRGWFVCFSAITSDGQTHHLGCLLDAAEIQRFTGQKGMWPEAAFAQHIGEELAEQYGAQFYFPSPSYPEDDCPQWNDRDKGYPCRRCGILLLQPPNLTWRGVCFHCHLAEEREQREAKWTPEQRAGRRCFICGNPATGELNGQPACADCLDKYEVYKCVQCGGTGMRSKPIDCTKVCSSCEAQNLVDSLSESQKETIRAAMTKGYFEGVRTAREVVQCGINKAQDVIQALGQQKAKEEQP